MPDIVSFIEAHVGTQKLLRTCTCSLLLLHILARPYWTYNPQNGDDWSNVQLYPSFGVSQTPATVHLPLTLIFLLLCFAGICAAIKGATIRSDGPYRKKVLMYVCAPLVIIHILGTLINISIAAATANYTPGFSLSPIEAFIFLSVEPCFESSLYITILRVQPYFFGLICILFCIIASWAAFGMVVVNSALVEDGSSLDQLDPYFNTFGNSLWNMLTVLNAANWPNPMIPSYSKNRGYFFFFMTFIVIVQWGFLSLILGLIIMFFDETWEDTVLSEHSMRMNRVNTKTVATLNLGKNQLEGEIISVTGKDTNKQAEKVVDSNEIVAATSNMSMGLQVPEESNIPQNISAPAQDVMKYLTTLRQVHKSWYYKAGSDVIFFVIGVWFCASPEPQTILIFQLVAKFLEILFSVIARDDNLSLSDWLFRKRNLQNVVLYLILLVNFSIYVGICETKSADGLSSGYALEHTPNAQVFGTQCKPSDLNATMDTNQNHVLLFSIIMIRTVIFIRICIVARSIGWEFFPNWVRMEFERLVSIIAETSSSFQYLVLAIFFLMYVFAAVGMAIFGGSITNNGSTNPNQEALNASAYGQSEFWALTFNDMPSGMFTLFTLLYVNNMQVTAAGYVAVTSQWAEVFFWVWYLVGVLLFMNIFTAFVWSRVAKILDDSIGYSEDALIAEALRLEADKLPNRPNLRLSSAPASRTASRAGPIDTELIYSYEEKFDEYERFDAQGEFDPYPHRMIARNLNGKSDAGHQQLNTGNDGSRMSLSKRMVEVLFDAMSAPTVVSDDMLRNSLLPTRIIEDKLHGNSGETVSKAAVNPVPVTLASDRESEQPEDSFFYRPSDMSHSLYQNVAHVSTKAFTASKVESRFGDVPVLNRRASVAKGRRDAMRNWITGEVNMSPQERSAVLMQYARHGEIHTLFSTRTSLKYFRLRCQLAYPLQIASWLLTLLRIFHQPAWIILNPHWDQNKYPTSMLAISSEVISLLKFPLFALVLVGFAVEIVFKVDSKGCALNYKPSIYLRYMFCAITLGNMIICIMGLWSNPWAHVTDWYLSIFSVLYIFWFDRNALRKMVIVLGVLPKLILLSAIFILFTLIMAAAAFFIFNLRYLPHNYQDYGSDDYLGGGYYINYGESVWSTFVDMTSSSFPGQVIPAVNAYREFAVFVVILISIGSFIILDIVLATVNFEFQRGVRYKEAYEERATVELIQSSFHILMNASQEFLYADTILRAESITQTAENVLNSSSVEEEKVKRSANAEIISSSNLPSDAPPAVCVLKLAKVKHLAPIIIDRLLDELLKNYTDFRKSGIPSAPMRAIFINILDINGDGRICINDFMYFLHCTRVKLHNVPDIQLLRVRENLIKHKLLKHHRSVNSVDFDKLAWTTRLYHTIKLFRWRASLYIYHLGDDSSTGYMNAVFKCLKFQKRYWDAIFDSIAGILCISSILSDKDLKDNFDDGGLVFQRNMIAVLIAFFFFEFLMKWLMFGMQLYLHNFRNRIDALIAVSMTSVFFISLSIGVFSNLNPTKLQAAMSQTLQLLTLVRLMLYPRNISCFANPVDGVSWDSILGTVGKIVFTFAEVFLCIAFTYAQIGCALFGGKIPGAGYDNDLDRSPYGQNNFYTLNFNDLPTSFYTLFSCLRVSDFDTITSGMVTVTSAYARLYFIIWYLFGSLLLFNIVKSYFISVFQHRKKDSEKHNIKDDVVKEKVKDVGDPQVLLNQRATSQKDTDFIYDEVEQELSELDLLNIDKEFIIDLRSLAATPQYISAGFKEDHFRQSPEEVKGTMTPLHELERDTQASASAASAASAAPIASKSTIENKPPWELAPSSTESLVQYAFTARLEFVREMDPRVRLSMLKRLKYLSDISRTRLGRPTDTSDQSDSKSSTSSLGDSAPRKVVFPIEKTDVATDNSL